MRRLLPPLVLLLAGCAHVHVVRTPEVVVKPAMQEFIAELHQRQQGHSTLPDQETLFCITGRVRGHRIHVDAIVPTDLYNRTERSLNYAPCRGSLGTYHTHLDIPDTDACRHSPTDIKTFQKQDYLLALISCTTPSGVVLIPMVRGDYWRKR
jgi:hypothetical protein